MALVLGTDAVLADPASESGAGLFASINATAATPQVLVQPRRPDFTAAAASAQPCSSCWLWESDSKSFSRRKSRDARLEAAQPLTHTCAGTRTGGRGPAQSRVELRLPSRRWKDAPGEQRRGGQVKGTFGHPGHGDLVFVFGNRFIPCIVHLPSFCACKVCWASSLAREFFCGGEASLGH